MFTYISNKKANFYAIIGFKNFFWLQQSQMNVCLIGLTAEILALHAG